jgi:hypothetical protein
MVKFHKTLMVLVFSKIGAGEGNRTLVSTYPILFLCKPLIYEGKACIVRFRELH